MFATSATISALALLPRPTGITKLTPLADTAVPCGPAGVGGTAVGGIAVGDTEVGGIAVGGTAVGGIGVGGMGVEAGPHPLSEAISITNARIGKMFFFKTYSSWEWI